MIAEGATGGGAGGADGAAHNSAPLAQLMSAPNGSIAAFVYGDGLADSGLPGTLAEDEIAFSARVASVGKDWVALDRELPFPVRAQWTGVLHAFEPTVQRSGVEQLTIRFNHSMMAAHLAERGYNAIELEDVVDCWIRQVTILNADNAIRLRGTDHSTLSDVTVGVTELRWEPDTREVNGHHAITVSKGHANLVTRFRITAPFYHDISLEGGALLNVISSGGGANLNLDLHRSGPWGNLFSQLGMGLAARPFDAGGRDGRGAHAGRQNTFWNLQPGDVAAAAPALQPSAAAGDARRLLVDGDSLLHAGTGQARLLRQLEADDSAEPLLLPSCEFGPLLNFVGGFAGELCKSSGWLVAGLPDDRPDLHASQVTARLQHGAADNKTHA